VSDKYIRRTDADRITGKIMTALAALEQELHRAIMEHIAQGMTPAEARAAAEKEVGAALKAADQIEASVRAELDAVAVESDDDGGA
jgi:hypothetical protein